MTRRRGWVATRRGGENPSPPASAHLWRSLSRAGAERHRWLYAAWRGLARPTARGPAETWRSDRADSGRLGPACWYCMGSLASHHPTRLPLLFRASSGALLAGLAGAPGREREERGAREGKQGRERRERARSRPNRRVAPLAASRDFYILRFLYPVIFTSPRRAEAQNSRNISGSHSEEPSNFSV